MASLWKKYTSPNASIRVGTSVLSSLLAWTDLVSPPLTEILMINRLSTVRLLYRGLARTVFLFKHIKIESLPPSRINLLIWLCFNEFQFSRSVAPVISILFTKCGVTIDGNRLYERWTLRNISHQSTTSRSLNNWSETLNFNFYNHEVLKSCWYFSIFPDCKWIRNKP